MLYLHNDDDDVNNNSAHHKITLTFCIEDKDDDADMSVYSDILVESHYVGLRNLSNIKSDHFDLEASD